MRHLSDQFRAFADRSATPPTPRIQVRSQAPIDRIQALEDWMQTHAELIRLETAFTDVVIHTAIGMVSVKELAQKRAELEGKRAECGTAFRNAFPEAH